MADTWRVEFDNLLEQVKLERRKANGWNRIMRIVSKYSHRLPQKFQLKFSVPLLEWLANRWWVRAQRIEKLMAESDRFCSIQSDLTD